MYIIQSCIQEVQYVLQFHDAEDWVPSMLQYSAHILNSSLFRLIKSGYCRAGKKTSNTPYQGDQCPG